MSNIKVAAEHGLDKEKLVDVYAHAIRDIMLKNRDVVQVESDLGACLLGGIGMWTLPEGQIFDVGIQENNMGTSLGVSG